MAEEAPTVLSAPQLCEAHKEGVTTIAYVPGKGGCITAGTPSSSPQGAFCAPAARRGAHAGRVPTLDTDHKPPPRPCRRGQADRGAQARR